MASLEDAVEAAVKWEMHARGNYLRWAEESWKPDVETLFRNLAKMEERHIQFLEGLDLGGDIDVQVSGIEWVNLAKDMRAVPSSEDRRLKSIFEFAMDKEEESVNRYITLGEASTGKVRELFLRLAMEEKHHKTMIRDEYHRLFHPTP